MNIFKSDEFGASSTVVAIFANVSTMAGLEIVNASFTWVISLLSIVWLVYKIKNEKSKYDKYNK